MHSFVFKSTENDQACYHNKAVITQPSTATITLILALANLKDTLPIVKTPNPTNNLIPGTGY
jgi:hypothetical protein